jgi:hypothetical protein
LLRVALLLLSLPLLAHGGEGMYYATRNRQVTTVTCPQVMVSAPEARWLRVVGCDIDYTHPAFTESGDRITGMYFAMRMRNERHDAPVSLVAATRDPQVLAVAQQALGNGAALDEEAFTIAMLRVVDILRAAREVDGYARGGIVERLLVRRTLAGFSAPLAPDVIVLDLHARPTFVRPGIEIGAGLLLLLAAAAWRRRKVVVVEPAPTPPPQLERLLPPAMLLNLDSSASVNDIEYAPPLGSREEVSARIWGVLGPLTEDGGKYSAGGDGWRIEFDPGSGEPVWAVAMDVRGSDAALAALDRLSRETNWRVFVPRLGTFR